MIYFLIKCLKMEFSTLFTLMRLNIPHQKSNVVLKILPLIPNPKLTF